MSKSLRCVTASGKSGRAGTRGMMSAVSRVCQLGGGKTDYRKAFPLHDHALTSDRAPKRGPCGGSPFPLIGRVHHRPCGIRRCALRGPSSIFTKRPAVRNSCCSVFTASRVSSLRTMHPRTTSFNGHTSSSKSGHFIRQLDHPAVRQNENLPPQCFEASVDSRFPKVG